MTPEQFSQHYPQISPYSARRWKMIVDHVFIARFRKDEDGGKYLSIERKGGKSTESLIKIHALECQSEHVEIGNMLRLQQAMDIVLINSTDSRSPTGCILSSYGIFIPQAIALIKHPEIDKTLVSSRNELNALLHEQSAKGIIRNN